MSREVGRARNRQMVIFLLVCLGIVVLWGRLYYWQGNQSYSGYQLAERARAEHVQNQTVNAARGLIYDANGHILATNVVRDDVYIEPIQFSTDHADNVQSSLTTYVSLLHRILSVPEDQLTKDFSLSVQTVRVAARIEPWQSQQLRNAHLSDIFLEPRTWRIYPGGNLASQILGYVTQDENNNRGVYGIEGQYNALLAGKSGSFVAETDLSGAPLIVGNSAEQPAIGGSHLTLTVDSSMQYMVQAALASTVKQLQAESGSVIVMNVRTGGIVAMAGEPTFDPNHYSAFAGKTGCLGNEGVFFNPVLYCAYEPGSTMKAVTMAAALDQHLITPDTSINDPGYITFHDDTAPVTNWANIGYGQETMTQVLEHSANVGAAFVAHDVLGAQRYYPYLTRFGFGKSTGIDGPEVAGYYRSPNSRDWSTTDLTRQAFGQGILATPLQVAMTYATIANGGVAMHPYLVSSINTNGHSVEIQPQAVQRVVSAQAAQQLTGMLTQAALEGSAHSVVVPGYTVAAKTGTATTQGISDTQTEASVAGFLPAHNPQFVILVKLDRPQRSIFGGTAAAPLWTSIAQQLMWYYHVPPDAS